MGDPIESMQAETRKQLVEQIFSGAVQDKQRLMLDIFQYQYRYCSVYKEFCTYLRIGPAVDDYAKIPFLPISLFKTKLISSLLPLPKDFFASSGTTGQVRSKHYFNDAGIYEKSFTQNFTQTFGNVNEYCVLGLLPSYSEQQEPSSLLYMVANLIDKAAKYGGGFFLHNISMLKERLLKNESLGIKTILFGVTYALLNFAEQHTMKLRHTIVIETGGMKGRKKELTRAEVHAILCDRLGLKKIHSEYGMTELFAQSYSSGDGIYFPNALLQICLREADDPFSLRYAVQKYTTGLLNVIDFSNIDSCSFIATDDIAVLHADGSFKIEGRADNTDIRGCSLLAL